MSQPPAKPTASVPAVTTSSHKLRFKKLRDDAVKPERGSAGAAGYDLSSVEEKVIPARSRELVATGLTIAIPEGTYARVAPRSGLAVKHCIDTGAGVIDEDYRGHVQVVLINNSEQEYTVKPGDRIAQLILERIMTPEVEEADEDFDATTRGSNGFGSTGFSAKKRELPF